MFPFDGTLSPWIGLTWLAVVLIGGFLVTWLVTDIGRVKRTPYVAVLSIVTGGLTAGFLAWSGAGGLFWTRSLWWSIAAAVVTSLVLLRITRRLPRASAPQHPAGLIAREGVVYGAAEGLLLSVLPVAVMWQVWRSFDWTGSPAAVAGGLVAVLASVAMIVVHHLGYWEFRGRLMRYPVVFCTVLSVSYLLTGNPIPAIVGHIVLHMRMIHRGIEMPPHAHPDDASEQEIPARAA